jgi:hypothetical protein
MLSFTRAVGLVALSASLGACKVGRPINAEYAQFREKLDGDDVIVAYFKDAKWVRQSAPDLCWAAGLEQALIRQDVDIDQARIVEIMYPRSDGTSGTVSHTTNFINWQFHPVLEARLQNGSKVWIRLDVYRRKASNFRSRYIQAIGRELWSDRIVLAGISTQPGQGHIVTIIGAAYPLHTKMLNASEMLGFLIYDPLTAKPYLVSIADFYNRMELIISVLTFDSAAPAIFYCGGACRDFMDEADH